jgi:transposase-like protein
MAMCILRLVSTNNTTERNTAMHKTKVVRKNDQFKLFLDPGLVAQGFDVNQLIQEMQLELRALGVSAGTVLMQKLIEAEAAHLVGKPYDRTSEYYAWGKQNGYVVSGGQKVRIEHPRIRRGRGKGEELVLESYRRFQEQDARTQAVFSRMLAQVSCRKYAQAIETMQAGYGISKSVVSREMVEATGKQLETLCHRRLDTIDLAVLIIDGIALDESMFIAALGVDTQGVKHLLGFVEGATETTEVCIALLDNLRERGLVMNRPVLVILDGSKGLYAAVRRFFGTWAHIQRCQEHKIRNVKSHLPKKYHAEIDRKLRAAYAMKKYDDALEALQGLVRELERLNVSAAKSLLEGLEETITIHRLEIPEVLRRSFATTNILESCYSRSRSTMHNVKRWRNSQHKARWIATALLEAERSFRHIKGYRSMSVLTSALERHTKKNIQQAA